METYMIWYFILCGSLFSALVIFILFGWIFAGRTDKRLAEKYKIHIKNIQEYIEDPFKTAKELQDIFSQLKKETQQPSDISKNIIEGQCKCNNIIADLSKLSRVYIKPEETLPRRKVYINFWILNFGLMLKIQILLTFFLFFSIELGCLGYNTVIKLSQQSYQNVPNITIDKVLHTIQFEDYFWGLFILLILFVALAALQKVTKFLIIQCDILFMGFRLSNQILFSEEFNRNRIDIEIAELVQNIKSKNSSGFLNNILDKPSL